MEEDFEIMPNLLDRRRLKDRIIESISKAVKNVRLWLILGASKELHVIMIMGLAGSMWYAVVLSIH